MSCYQQETHLKGVGFPVVYTREFVSIFKFPVAVYGEFSAFYILAQKTKTILGRKGKSNREDKCRTESDILALQNQDSKIK